MRKYDGMTLDKETVLRLADDAGFVLGIQDTEIIEFAALIKAELERIDQRIVSVVQDDTRLVVDVFEGQQGNAPLSADIKYFFSFWKLK